jgi:hypothetical protein
MSLRTHKCGVVAAFTLILFSAGSIALAAGLTAKASLTQVVAAGKKWQSDAVLVSLSSVKVHPDGSADEWKYSFYSPGTRKRCIVTAGASGIRTKEVNLGYSTEPLGDFIDSDKAMQEAKKNGLKGNDLNMAVKFQGTGRSAAAYWIVNGGFAKGDISIFLEANTGKFSSRAAME